MVGVGYVLALSVGAVAAVLVVPVYLSLRLRDARPPSGDEGERVAALREEGSLDVERAYVIDTVGRASVDVAVRGPPGRRVLFVTDYVLDDLDGEVAAALFAAEAGRVETHHGEFRALAVGVVVGTATAAFAALVPPTPGFAALGVVALVAFAVGRRIQYAADARAADRVGADRLADAFEHVADLRDVDPETGGWGTLFETQPPLGDRIERLRDRA